MVVLAAVATVIASQAVISGAFSMTRQAVLLGYLPRFEIRHTSEAEIGQIYVPKINLFLLIAVLALVLGFQSSDNLGAAYGIAVTGTMSLTTMLALIYTVGVAGWNNGRREPAFRLLPLGRSRLLRRQPAEDRARAAGSRWSSARMVFVMMITWMRGREQLLAERWREALPLETFLATLKPDRPLARAGDGGVHGAQRPTSCRRRCCTTSSTTRCCTSASC